VKVINKKQEVTNLTLELNKAEIKILIKAIKRLGKSGKVAGFNNSTEQMLVVELNEKLDLFGGE
jgi:hypothetical protein